MQPETVHLFVFDSLSDWEPSYAVAGINSSPFQLRPGRYRVATVGLTALPIRTVGGLAVLPDMTLDSLRPADSALLILPGGMAWEQGQNMEAAEKAREFVAAGVPVAGICAATAALARVGLLDDRAHTSNSLDYIKQTRYGGEAFYRNELAVSDRDVITAGGAAPLEFAREIFKRLGIYREKTLDAWYALFKTGDMTHYVAMLQSVKNGAIRAKGD